MTEKGECWRIVITGKWTSQRILVGSEESANQMMDKIRTMPKDRIVDWGDGQIAAGEITGMTAEKFNLGMVH